MTSPEQSRGLCTGTIADFDVLSGRGIITANDGGSQVEFTKRDVIGDELPIPGAAVRFQLRMGAFGEQARGIEFVEESEPCPCGSGRAYQECHRPVGPEHNLDLFGGDV